MSKPENPKSIGFFDCSGAAFARRASALVLRRRIRSLRIRLARFHADQSAATTSFTAASTCAIRRSRSRSAAGGCPARGRATTSCRRRATRSTRAIAPTTPTSIRSGRTAVISPISTAACSCSIFPTRRIRRRFRNGPIRRPIPASCTPSVPLFDRGLMLVTDESTENNAKDWPKLVWVLDARDETNPVSIATCPMPRSQNLCRGRPVRRA